MSSIEASSVATVSLARRVAHFARRFRIADAMGQWLLPFSCSLVRSIDSLPEFDPDDESSVEWLHVFLLKVSLRHLRDGRVGRDERDDCYRWVFGDDDEPFSFAACCNSAGYDPDTLRDHVRRTVRAMQKSKGDTDARTTCEEGVPGVLPEADRSVPARHRVPVRA